jgi:hypothetical protein
MAFEPHILQSLRDHLGLEVADVLNDLHEKVNPTETVTDKGQEVDVTGKSDVMT